MRIGIYNPYLDTLGGGERYSLALASHWSHSHDVHLFWDDESIQKKAKERLNIDLSKIIFVQNVFREKNILKKLFITRAYDLIFFLSDGSIPFSLAKSNILHFQSPFIHVHGRSVGNTLKLRNFTAVVCNSIFTKSYIDAEFGVDSSVIYPPVAVNEFKADTKENSIVSVGRFSSYRRNKKQIEMVQFFRELHARFNNWSFSIAGGLRTQDRSYFDEVKRMAEGLPITLHPNASFSEVKKLYGRAKLYWHAAGFGEKENENPAGMEHFGMSTVEAMAAGCVPLVYAGGGQTEIIHNGIDGILWQSQRDLIERSSHIISHDDLRIRMQKSAQTRAKDFNQFKFYAAFDRLIAGIT
jgi:glycosyltransferase involved in cell wall biosynthesis